MSDGGDQQFFNWGALLKHAATTLGELGVIAVFAQSFIVAFGGRIPPWPLDTVVQQMIDRSVAASELRANARECADYNSRYLRAALVLRQMPNDPAAQLQFSDDNNQIDMIPNCKKAIIP